MRPVSDRGPRLPEGLRIYAIGDVHGHADLLEGAFRSIDADLKRRPAAEILHVFLGDYIDRGPHSRETIELLIARAKFGPVTYLKGNHEDVLLWFMLDPTVLQDWQRFGGLQTLISYGLRPSSDPGHREQIELARDLAAAVPAAHLAFLQGLRPCFTCGDFFFVHAGVRPGVALKDQQEKDLLWIRDEFLSSDRDFGKFVVHGHTPVREPDLRPNRLNIDTGAYASGRLTVLAIEGAEFYFPTSQF